MSPQVTITQIPHLNTVVIRQKDYHAFFAVPNSIVIEKESYLSILKKLLEMGFISEDDLLKLFKGAR